jgi:hypothetical protein
MNGRGKKGTSDSFMEDCGPERENSESSHCPISTGEEKRTPPPTQHHSSAHIPNVIQSGIERIGKKME